MWASTIEYTIGPHTSVSPVEVDNESVAMVQAWVAAACVTVLDIAASVRAPNEIVAEPQVS